MAYPNNWGTKRTKKAVRLATESVCDGTGSSYHAVQSKMSEIEDGNLFLPYGTIIQ